MIAAFVLTIAFPGGGDATLVRSIAAVGNRNIVLLADPARQTAAYRHDFDSEVGVRVVLGRMYDLGWTKDGTGYSGTAFPLWVIFRNQKGFEPLATDEPPRVQGGGVTFTDTPGKTIGLKEVAKLFPDKLGWSWFFDDERFAVSVKGIAPRALLDLVAKAGGGRVVEKDGSLRVEIDPTALRKRAREEFARIKPNGLIDEVDVEFMEELYGSLTDTEIAAAYATRETQYPLSLRTARLESLAIQRARHLLQRSEKDTSQTPRDCRLGQLAPKHLRFQGRIHGSPKPERSSSAPRPELRRNVGLQFLTRGTG